jgi:hypothetical protein
MGTTQCAYSTSTTDPRGPFSYSLHCLVPLSLFLPLRHTSFLACSSAIPSVLPLVVCFNFRISFTSLKSAAFLVRLVAVCIILSSTSSPIVRTACNSKIRIWLSSAWHHLSWSICSIWHRSPRLLSAVSRNHQHLAHFRLQLSNSNLQRLCSCHGSGQRFSRIV